MRGRVGPRIAVISAVLTLVAGVVGLIVTLVLSAVVFDEFDAYGEIPVPGSGSVALPAGEVTINFHTAVPGGIDGGFPVPPLKVGIDAPDGVPEPVLTERIGSTTSVNNDVHVHIWNMQVAQDGVYDVRADGSVGGYIQPRLAFGRDSSPAWPLWLSGGLIALGLLVLGAAIAWWIRADRRPRPIPGPIILD
ncbi:MAG: SHOCT domain-containing protein [Actinomycetota bacterium]